MFALKEYPDAEDFFRGLLSKYKYNWVFIGLANRLLKQEKFQEAQALIDSLKMRDDTRCSVHDLMAQHFVEKSDFKQAYVEISEAARLAPRNIERNKRKWDLSRLNHDRIGQLKATITMAKYAKKSIHDSPEFGLNVIRSHIDLANSLGEESAAQLLLAEDKYAKLSSVPRFYRELKAQFEVISARIHSAKGEKRQAEAVLRNLVLDKDSNHLEFNFDLIKARHEVGDWEGCTKLLKESMALAENDSFSGIILNRYIEQELDERSEIHFTPKELTEMAAAYHSQEKFGQAMNMLDQALRLSPQNIHLAMNIMKVANSICEKRVLNHTQKRTTHETMVLLQKSTLDDEQQESFQNYRRQVGDISELDLVGTSLSS